jgi:hypothetical protein
MKQSDMQSGVGLQGFFNSKFPNIRFGAPRDVKEKHGNALSEGRRLPDELIKRRKP